VESYATHIQSLFREAYFIETWINELETQHADENEKILLLKLGRIAQFL